MIKIISGLSSLCLNSLNKNLITTFNYQTFRLFSFSTQWNRKLDSRAYPPYMLPSSKNKRWVELKAFNELYNYTVDPLPFPKTGGRGPNGRIWNHKRGGGRKRVFHMIDWVRGTAEQNTIEEPLAEKIIEIKPDQNRSGHIAMVAHGEKKRYIIASECMKVGDIIKTNRVVSKTPVRPQEGDSYPLGSLPIGTLVNCVERFPGKGGYFARAAGTSAQLVKKEKDKDGMDICVVKLPSKREAIVSSACVATVGKVSNPGHNKEHWGKAGAKRNAGIRPRSGRWHRKDGRFGRKIRALPPPLEYKEFKPFDNRIKYFTMSRPPGLYQQMRFYHCG